LALRALTLHAEDSENTAWGEGHVGVLTVGSDPPEHVYLEAVVGGRQLLNFFCRGCGTIGPLKTEGEWTPPKQQGRRDNQQDKKLLGQ